MHKILLSCALVISLTAGAQKDVPQAADSVEVQIIQLPDSTAIGIPNGKKLTKEIGPTGGTVISDDGKVELTFPEGALSNATHISIQPVECLIPNGNKAYQFEPSGIQFQKPVQIIFRYSQEEANICPPDLRFMALQDRTGKWEYLHYDEWDSAAKSLKGSITHFSSFVDGHEAKLDHTEITLKVGKTHSFVLNYVVPPDKPGEDELPPLPLERGTKETVWKVNEKIGGSAKHGTIVADQGKLVKATYTAPANLAGDEITVKLDLNKTTIREIRQRSGRWRGITRIHTTTNLATFTCKVKLYDEYKVTVSHDFKVEGGRMTDVSSFLLRVGVEDRASISDISNQMAKVHIEQKKCKAIYVNEATCVGMINVTGLRTSNVSSTPHGTARVDLFFSPAPLVFPVINFPPCGNNRVSNTTPRIAASTAFPMHMNFEAKNEKQYISLGTGSVVSKPDPDDVTATIEPVRE